MFERINTTGNRPTLFIPPDIFKFAHDAKMADERPRGKGKGLAVRLEDIYLTLLMEGFDLVTPETVFYHVEKTPLSRGAKITVPVEVHKKLKALQGEVNLVGNVEPHLRTKKKVEHTDIMLESLTLNLIRLAIKKRENEK